MGFARVLQRQRRKRQQRRMRLCDGCLEAVERRLLLEVAGQTLCPSCVTALSLRPPGEDRRERPAADPAMLSMAAGTAPFAAWSEEAELDAPEPFEARIDRWLRYALIFGRCVFYLVLYLLAQRHHVVRMVFQGLVMADVLAWGLRALLELRQARLVLLCEFVAWIAIVRLCYELPGALQLPDSVEDRGLVGITFMTVFGIRLILWVLRGQLDPGEDEE